MRGVADALRSADRGRRIASCGVRREHARLSSATTFSPCISGPSSPSALARRGAITRRRWTASRRRTPAPSRRRIFWRRRTSARSSTHRQTGRRPSGPRRDELVHADRGGRPGRSPVPVPPRRRSSLPLFLAVVIAIAIFIVDTISTLEFAAMDAAATLATVVVGRGAAVAELRQLADRLGRLALADAAEVLIRIEPALAELRRQDALANAELCP